MMLTQTQILINDNLTTEVRGDAVVISDWHRNHQVALTAESLADLDRLMAALTEVRAHMIDHPIGQVPS